MKLIYLDRLESVEEQRGLREITAGTGKLRVIILLLKQSRGNYEADIFFFTVNFNFVYSYKYLIIS